MKSPEDKHFRENDIRRGCCGSNNSLYFSLLQGIFHREGLALDRLLRQPNRNGAFGPILIFLINKRRLV